MSKGLLEMGAIFPPYSPMTLDLSAMFGDEILEPHFAENSVIATPPDTRARSWITP